MYKDKQEYITKTNLIKERNWSKTEIDKFLICPDLTKPNNKYKKGPNICLYLINRVLEVEQLDEYKKHHEKTIKLKESSKKSIQTKKVKLFEEVKSVPIEIPKYTKEELSINAVLHYNNIHQNFISIEDLKKDIDFSNRIIVNYIRHVLSNYEEYFEQICGKVGNEEVLRYIRQQIYKKIGDVYPFLRKECKIQYRIRYPKK